MRNALLPIEFKPQWKELGICCAKTFSNVPKWKAKERCHEVMKWMFQLFMGMANEDLTQVKVQGERTVKLTGEMIVQK